jgi:hypothetical protein
LRDPQRSVARKTYASELKAACRLAMAILFTPNTDRRWRLFTPQTMALRGMLIVVPPPLSRSLAPMAYALRCFDA